MSKTLINLIREFVAKGERYKWGGSNRFKIGVRVKRKSKNLYAKLVVQLDIELWMRFTDVSKRCGLNRSIVCRRLIDKYSAKHRSKKQEIV